MRNWPETVISQYANSPVTLGLLESFNDAIDPSANIDAFYNLVWNVDTAVGYGLDVWGRIVGVSRVLTVPSGDYLGFSEAESWVAFGAGTFYSGPNSTENFILTDVAYRALILIKALANISDCSARTLNTILRQLFPGRGNAYVLDLGNMKMRMVFEFLLEPFEYAILTQSGAFPHPTGVGIEIMQLSLPYRFGFAEAGPYSAAPFGQGTFFGGPPVAI